MLRTTIDHNRLHLTAELRAIEGMPQKASSKMPGAIFASEMKRFPPVEDLVAVLDRIAKSAFIA